MQRDHGGPLVCALGDGAPLPTVLASFELLDACVALLLPHDGRAVVDVRACPERWEHLKLVRRAVLVNVPVLGWGSGAALLGRALGASVEVTGDVAPLRIDARDTEDPLARLIRHRVRPWVEASAVPRGGVAVAEAVGRPVLFRVGPHVGFAAVRASAAFVRAFVDGAARVPERRAASLLERVGGRECLRVMLGGFYEAAVRDDVLGPVFVEHVRDWDAHLERVTDFWVMVLGGGGAYGGDFVGAHASLGVTGEHVRRWLALFRAACVQAFGEDGAAVADRADVMAARLGAMRRRAPA